MAVSLNVVTPGPESGLDQILYPPDGLIEIVLWIPCVPVLLTNDRPESPGAGSFQRASIARVAVLAPVNRALLLIPDVPEP